MDIIESHNVEFKEILSNSFEKEVVAFLNAEGGKLYIGVDDNGVVVGLDDASKTSVECTNKLKTNISPSIIGLYTNEVLDKDGKKYVLISLSSGVQKPYFIRKKGMSTTGCYVRKGACCVSMDQPLIDKLYRSRINYDLKTMKSPIQNLTFRQLKIYYEEKKLSVGDYFLDSLGFYMENHTFNYLAYLFADNNDISIKVAKFTGQDKIDLESNEEYGYCCLIKACDSVLDRLNIENTTTAKITAKLRNEIRLVDDIALREAVINAIVHHDYTNTYVPTFFIYNNRIVVESGGGLPNNLTKQDFYKGMSKPRNPDIVRIFKDLGFVEQLGSGMTRILSVYNKNIFQISDDYIDVEFKYNKDAMERITINEDAIVKNGLHKLDIETRRNTIRQAIDENRKIRVAELAILCNVTERTIKRDISTMDDIEYVISGNKGYWKIR